MGPSRARQRVPGMSASLPDQPSDPLQQTVHSRKIASHHDGEQGPVMAAISEPNFTEILHCVMAGFAMSIHLVEPFGRLVIKRSHALSHNRLILIAQMLVDMS